MLHTLEYKYKTYRVVLCWIRRIASIFRETRHIHNPQATTVHYIYLPKGVA